MNTNKFCPHCKVELWLMSTINQWCYKCPSCRHRFNEDLVQMPEV